MADVFLSYAREDEAQARRVSEALTSRGWTVWWDDKLASSERFRKVIDEQLRAAHCVVVLWSAHSIDSDWVIEEAEDGKKKGALVQALLDDVTPPRGFREIHFANLRGWDGRPAGREFLALERGVALFIAPAAAEPTGRGAAGGAESSGMAVASRPVDEPVAGPAPARSAAGGDRRRALQAQLDALAALNEQIINDREQTREVAERLREWKKRVTDITGSDFIYDVQPEPGREGPYASLRSTIKQCRRAVEERLGLK